MEWGCHDDSSQDTTHGGGHLYGLRCLRVMGFWGILWIRLVPVKLARAWQYDIMAEELVPVVVVAAVWGQDWQGQTVKAWCDNSAVVANVMSGSQMPCNCGGV